LPITRPITAAEWHAAADFRELWDQVARSALLRSPIGRASMGIAAHRAFDGSLAGELDAHNRLREIRRRLGAFASTLLYLSVVRDLSWAALGRQYDRDQKTARLGDCRHQSASYRLNEVARNGEGPQTGW
jgi:hypothetical protein